VQNFANAKVINNVIFEKKSVEIELFLQTKKLTLAKLTYSVF
jgi:hypothetical protein